MPTPSMVRTQCLVLAVFAPVFAAQPVSFERLGLVIPPGATGRLSFGDLDADGDEDILSIAGGVFLNDGFGNFEAHPTPSPALTGNNAAFSGRILLVDVDGDADADAIHLPDQTMTGPALWLNGGGVFYPAPFFLPPLPATGYQPAYQMVWDRAAPADFDGDGDLDLFLAPVFLTQGGHQSYPTQRLPRLWLNQGMGWFVEATPNLPGQNLCAGTVLARDWDQDGDIDILVFRHPYYPVYYPPLPAVVLLVNSGAATFTVGTGLPAGAVFPPESYTGDVNGDGRADVLGSGTWNDSLFHAGQPGGGIGPATTVPLPAPGMVLEVEDLDGDGRAEVIAGFAQDLRVLTLAAGGNAFLVRQTLPADAGGWFRRAQFSDLDGDGDGDLLVDSGSRRMAFVRGVSGSLSEIGQSLTASVSGTPLKLADLDGDGDLDLLTVFGTQGASLNDGIGRFSPGPPITVSPTASTVPPLLHPFDADGDGDLDLYQCQPAWSAEPERILRHDGPAGWVEWQVLSLPALGPYALAVTGDLDGDGDQDVIRATAGSDVILVNDGTGALGAPMPFAGAAAPSVTLLVLDLDGDGDLDVFSTAGSLGCRRFLNLGGLVFAPAMYPGLVGVALAAGDVDGDGDPDIVLRDRWLRNDGSGNFSALGPAADPPWTTGNLVLEDLDLDGDLDLLCSLQPEGSLEIRTNNGAGSFALSRSIPAAVWAYGPLVGDVDRDGDPDIIDDRPALWQNRRIQIAAEGIPVPGGRVRMRLFGPPQSPYQLFASTGRADLALPPFGRVLIDPAFLFPVASGTFDATGGDERIFPIPDLRALAGLTIYWQSYLPGAARLSNATATAILDG